MTDYRLPRHRHVTGRIIVICVLHLLLQLFRSHDPADIAVIERHVDVNELQTERLDVMILLVNMHVVALCQYLIEV